MSEEHENELINLRKQVKLLTKENEKLLQKQLKCLKTTKRQYEELVQKQEEIEALKDIVREQSNLLNSDKYSNTKETVEQLQVEVARLKLLVCKERSHSRSSIHRLIRKSLVPSKNIPKDNLCETDVISDSIETSSDSEDEKLETTSVTSSLDAYEKEKTFSEKLQEEVATKRAKIMQHRTSIAKEILMTEESYVAVLDVICDNFLIPLQNAARGDAPILNDNEIKNIFSCVEVLRNFNRFFLDALEARVNNWEETQQLGDLFMELSIWMRSYGAYINNYDIAMETYRYCMKTNTVFVAFIQNALGKKQSDLTFLLIAPIQRLPRYVLFLKDLVKYTSTEHSDYDELVEALETVKTIANDVNKAKARFEETEMVFEAAARFDRKFHSDIVAPARLFTRDMFMFCHPPESEDLSLVPFRDIRVVILFSDLLVLSKPKEHPFRDLDSFSRPQLVTARKKKNVNKRVTAFQQKDHDLEMISAITLTNVFLGDSPHDECELKFIVNQKEAYTFTLFTNTSEEREEFLAYFAENQKTLAGRTIEDVHIPPKRRKFFSRRMHKISKQ